MTDALALFEALKSRGYNPAAAAGLVGNWGQESNFNSSVIGDQGTSGGLGQWHNDRLNQLKSFAAASGHPWTDPLTQVAFADKEIHADPRLLAALQGATSPTQAADIVSSQYERPNPTYANNPHREALANQVFTNKLGSGVGPTQEKAQAQFGAVGLPPAQQDPQAAVQPTAPSPQPQTNPMADLAASLTSGIAAANLPKQAQSQAPAQQQAPPQTDPRALAQALLANTTGPLVLS